MSQIRYSFGEKNGKIVSILELSEDERGRACGCVCPVCKGHFLARMGDVRRPHFSHDGKPCDEVQVMLESMYRMLQEAIEEWGMFVYPGCYVKYNGVSEEIQAEPKDIIAATAYNRYPESKQRGYEELFPEGKLSVKGCEVQKSRNGLPEAMSLTKYSGGKLLSITIVPPPSLCADFKPKSLNEKAVLAIRINEDMLYLSSEKLRSRLCRGCEDKEWIKSPRLENWRKEKLEEQHKQHKIWHDAEDDIEKSKREVQAIIKTLPRDAFRSSRWWC